MASQERRRTMRGIALRIAIALWLIAAFSAALPTPTLARTAYVGNQSSSAVSVFDTTTNTAGTPIPLGTPGPFNVAITPDGRRAYVTHFNGGTGSTVSVIDTASNTAVGMPISVGTAPFGVAITPDGSRAYVVNKTSDTVSVIDTATNTTVGAPIPVGNEPRPIAITPDGTRAYVASFIALNSGSVSVIDTATNTVVGSPIPVGNDPEGIAITPDGRRAYVTNFGGPGPSTVSVIDIATNTTVGSAIPVGTFPFAIAITPDGTRAYVANEASNNVYVIDTATNTTVGAPITVGADPDGIAVTPDGTRAYVANSTPDTVSVIDTATNTTVGAPIPVANIGGVAITPNQGPVASFSVSPAPPGSASQFDGSGSSDPDGTVARYDWDFGDGTTLTNGGPITTHVYATPGTYTATLTVTDNEGCSSAFVFTGQTASCNGGSKARAEQQVTIRETIAPTLKLSGPRNQPLDAAVEINVRCDEDCTATGTGKLIVRAPSGKGGKLAAKGQRRPFKLREATKQLEGDKKGTLRLKVSRKARRAGLRALRNGGHVVARITVSAADAVGNVATAKRRVTLRARSRGDRHGTRGRG